MAEPAKIRTPFWRHLQQIRYRLLPVVVFSLAALGTAWLWGHQQSAPHVIGEVATVRLDLTSHHDGTLVAPAEGWPELLAEVRPGQVLARLDDREILALLAGLRSDLTRLENVIQASAVQIRHDEARNSFDRLTDMRRLALDVEQLKLNMLDRRAELQSGRIDLLRAELDFQAVEQAFQRGVETEYTLSSLGLVRDEVRNRVEGMEQALSQARDQLTATEQRLGQYTEAERQELEVDTVLAPLRDAVATQRARIAEYELRADAMVVRSPLAGRVSAVHRLPGQSVRAGDVIISVAADRSQVVVGYIRDGQRLVPAPGTPVLVRNRSTQPKVIVQGEVERVGGHIEPLPERHLRHLNSPEWGMPVTIRLPASNRLTPGELVDLSFEIKK